MGIPVRQRLVNIQIITHCKSSTDEQNDRPVMTPSQKRDDCGQEDKKVNETLR